MARAKNKDEFIDSIKIMMGYPVISIPISDAQWDLILEDALNFYTSYVYDGVQEVFFPLDVEIGQKEFDFNATGMPQNIHSIKDIMFTTYATGLFPMPYGVNDAAIKFFFSIGQMGHGNLADGSIMFQNLEMFQKLFLPKTHWDFNFNTSILTLSSHSQAAYRVGVLATQLIDFEGTSTGNLWNNSFFRKYCFLAAKIQYGINLGGLLVSGASAPGGHSVNFDKLIDESETKLEELKQWAYENLCGSEIYKIEIG